MQLLEITEPVSNSKKDIAIGIDLGTTNSLAAYVKGNKVITTQIVPSIVSEINGRFYAGKVKSKAKLYRSVKRKIGKQLNDEIPVIISAEILKEVKKLAEKKIKEKVTKAVITVPAYFDDAARQATKDAAKLAGLEVLRLINEPTAAALAYGLDEEAEGTYAIYDLGGGTFDVSILKMQKGIFEVIATGGDTELGGDDIDALLAKKLSTSVELAKEYKENADSDQNLIAEIAKPLIDKTIKMLNSVMIDAGLEYNKLDGLVLVGGSTKLLFLKDYINKLTGIVPFDGVDPDKVVAVGAAIQAYSLVHGSDTLLLDVNPLSLGIETMGGIVEVIIPRNSTLPIVKSQTFTTYEDGQSAMSIHVVQGEREIVERCRSLAKFELSNLPPLPAGLARVTVTFMLDADGILTVFAKEETTGIEQKVLVKPSYGLPQERMAEMLMDSIQNAREDITDKLLLESKFEAKIAVKSLSEAIKQDRDLILPEELRKINEQIEELNTLLMQDDRDKIDMAVKNLDQIATDFAERRVNNALSKITKGKDIAELENIVHKLHKNQS